MMTRRREDPNPGRGDDSADLELRPCEALQSIKDVELPAQVRFRQIIATGPPGAGKSHLIRRLGGWPEEGYIDLTFNHWWRAQPLTLRPREVNLGLPFVGHRDPLTVFDEEWLEAREMPAIDRARIVFPPPRRHILATNWQRRYAFFFLVPPPRRVLAARASRASEGLHPVDAHLSLEQVGRQVDVYAAVARLFHLAGLETYVIDDFDASPKYLARVQPGGRARVEERAG